MGNFKSVILLLLLVISANSYGQMPDSLAARLPRVPDKFYAKVEKKYSCIEESLSRKSVKYLKKLQKQENSLTKKLHGFDSATIALNNDVNEEYNHFINSLTGKGKKISDVKAGQYNAYMDSLSTSLSFLKKFDPSGKAGKPMAALDNLKDKLNQSEKVNEFIGERRQQLQQLLSGYTKVPASLKKEFARLNKTGWYYKAQVAEYKSMLKDPEKIEKKALSLLNQMPFFQKFMKENSKLASLFGLPENYGTAASLAGLQTRASVQGMIQQRVAAGGPNAMAQVQQNLAAAHAEINKLKDKINQFGGGSGDLEMPDFKPNSQKTKPLLKRLEYSANVQFAKSNSLLPSTANIGLGIGFKLDDIRIVGIGASYAVGMGTIQHISFSSQGIGLRSYLDWKIKKQIYLTGGYEISYNSAFKNIEQLKDYDAWQRSALLGLSKRYKISKKVQGNMQLLYDFLANSHVPVSQPVVFRLGYSFK
ncbi:MAG: hypothetical protein ACTHK0_02405 [Ginsengibacter sp.]